MNIDSLLQYYSPGKPIMKPDVLEQMIKLEETRRKHAEKMMIEGNVGGKVMIQQDGQEPMALNNNQVVELMTARLSPNAQVIFGARQDPAFGDTIKVMSIITGVISERLNNEMLSADMLGEALNIAKKVRNKSESEFQRFD